jgi:RNA polymerase primary sigma factor
MANQYINDFNESVKIYYEDLKDCKPLSKEEERKLIIKAKEGDIAAQNKVLKANLRFVFDVAKKYKGSGVPMEDLIAEGNIGMITAIKKFNLDYDVKFFCYAVWWIKQSMQAFIKNKQKSLNIEKGEDELNSNIKQNAISDNEDEIVNKRETILSNEEDERNKEIEKSQKVVVDRLLVNLDKREKLIIEQYYGLNGNKERNLDEIGSQLGISMERVRQIKKRILFRMRSEVLCMSDVGTLFKN